MHAAVAMATASASCKGIVHLWALDAVPAPGAPVEALDRYEREACGSVLDLVQEVTAQRPVPVTLVTRGARPVTPESLTAAPAAALWGMGQAIALEHPELHEEFREYLAELVDAWPARDPRKASK